MAKASQTKDGGREEPGLFGWVVLGTFTLNYTVVVIVIMTLGLLLPDIAEEFNLSPSQQGWLASSVLFGNLFFEVPLNWLASKFRPRRVASFSFLVAALLVFFIGLSPSLGILILVRVVLGLVYLSTRAPRTLVIMQWLPRRHIGWGNAFLFSAIEGLEGIGFIIIPIILVAVGDWRDTLYIWAGVILVTALFWIAVGRDRFPAEYIQRLSEQTSTPLGSLIRYKEIWIIGLSICGAVAGRFALSTFWPTFTRNEYQTDITIAGLVIGIMSIAIGIAILGVNLVPFFRAHISTLLAICGIGLSVTYVGMLFTGSVLLLFLLGILSGVFFTFFPAAMTMLYTLPGIRPREVAVAVALIYTMMWAGAGLGPLVTGFIQEATGDLRLALLLVSLTPLGLSLGGVLLSDKVRATVRSALTPIPSLK